VSNVLNFPKAYLSRYEAAELLTAVGLPTSVGRLERLAYRREGPPYGRWGTSVVYPRASLTAWAHECLTRAGERGRTRRARKRP
jgi:hypothetical protein